MKTIVPITLEELQCFKNEPHITMYLPSTDITLMACVKLPKRIMERITVRGTCWCIGGWNTDNGFANISIKGKTRKMHRVVFTLIRGPIPEGHVIDHVREICQHRNCSNPWHHEPVTDHINTVRGNAKLYEARA